MNATFVLDDAPDDRLISNVHALALLGGQLVIVRGSSGWELPGGTREPGETVDGALKRELLEEIGGGVVDSQPLGAWRCQSSAPAPYKPHIPHPEFAILVVVARLSALQPPVGWANDEGHSAIMLTSPDDAIRLLEDSDDGRPHADVVRLVRDRVADASARR